MSGHVLIARLDRLGDVLLTGPLVRAVAATADQVTFLAGPAGAEAAELLPGVDRVVVEEAGWVVDYNLPVNRRRVEQMVDRLALLKADSAVILTSFHQSPLPTAMVLRMAGVAHIGAISSDSPGTLLDIRHHVPDDIHEVERSLSLGRAMGFHLPADDDTALRIHNDGHDCPVQLPRPYIAVHPGTTATARAWSPQSYAATVRALTEGGWSVAVTGNRSEKNLTSQVAGRYGIDLGGQLDLAGLASVLEDAEATVVGNTGPAHLSAAVGTPVVDIYAPTVPAVRWHPWKVRHAILGNQHVPCAGCRASLCPVPGHPCVENVSPAEVADAAERLAAGGTYESSSFHSPAPDLIGVRK